MLRIFFNVVNYEYKSEFRNHSPRYQCEIYKTRYWTRPAALRWLVIYTKQIISSESRHISVVTRSSDLSNKCKVMKQLMCKNDKIGNVLFP